MCKTRTAGRAIIAGHRHVFFIEFRNTRSAHQTQHHHRQGVLVAPLLILDLFDSTHNDEKNIKKNQTNTEGNTTGLL